MNERVNGWFRQDFCVLHWNPLFLLGGFVQDSPYHPAGFLIYQMESSVVAYQSLRFSEGGISGHSFSRFRQESLVYP